MVESLSGLLRTGIQPLLEAFKNPAVAYSIAATILLFATILFMLFLSYIAIKVLPLLSIQRKIRSILRGHRRPFSPDEFNTIDAVILRHKMLRHGWEEFKETLIYSDESIRNTVRPSAYLNVAMVSKRTLPFFQSVPNYFVGIGLLATFLGLIAGLSSASEGVTGDLEQAKRALGDLLTAATFKFLTSIAGLFASLALSILIKIVVLQFYKSFDTLCRLLEEGLVAVTPEGIAKEQVDETKRQTLLLERFNTDFAVEVAKALETRLNASLGPTIGHAMQPAVAAIEGISKHFGEINQDGMRQMIDGFHQKLSGAAGVEMRALAETIAGLKDALLTSIAGVGQSSGVFSDRMEAAAHRLDALMRGAAQTLETSVSGSARSLEQLLEAASGTLAHNMNRASTDFGIAFANMGREFQAEMASSADVVRQTLGQSSAEFGGRMNMASQQLAEVAAPFAIELGRLSETLRALDGRMQSQLSGFDGSMTRLSALMEGFDQALSRLKEAGTPIADMAGRFSLAAEQLESTSRVMGDVHESIAILANALEAGAEQVHDTWGSYKEHFEKLDEQLATAFTRIQQGGQDYARQVFDHVQRVDAELAKAVNSLRGGVEELGDRIEDLAHLSPGCGHPPSSNGQFGQVAALAE